MNHVDRSSGLQKPKLLDAHLHGTPRLMGILLYGAGLRLLECARLRVKDVDFASHQILVRGGKGDKDRVTLLPFIAKLELSKHLEFAHFQHQRDLERGAGWVELPNGLARKYPNAGREWGWQWVFPATRIYVDRETGSGGGTISTNRFCNEPSRRLSGGPVWPNRPLATPSGTRLRPISLRMGTTSGRSRNSSATPTSAQP